ncbi:MAG: DUF3109 family protein [Candidatus Riflebacteria bacterium]|nr:DUF3109 family protein [Candidatus Riflebacteria bacterium]
MHIIENVIISDEVWETSFQCDLNRCGGNCCRIGNRGAPISIPEEKKILNNISDISNKLSRKNRTFIEAGITEQFKGKTHIREIAPDHPCPLSFTNDDGIVLCSIHSLCLDRNVSYMNLKPQWCALFPLIITEGNDLYTINVAVQDHCRSTDRPPHILKSFSEPLIHILGKEWYKKLLARLPE